MWSRKNWYAKKIDTDIPDDSVRLRIARMALHDYRSHWPNASKRYMYEKIHEQIRITQEGARYLIKQVKYREKLDWLTEKEKQEALNRQWEEKQAMQVAMQKCLENAYKLYVKADKRDQRRFASLAKKQRKAIRKGIQMS